MLTESEFGRRISRVFVVCDLGKNAVSPEALKKTVVGEWLGNSILANCFLGMF